MRTTQDAVAGTPPEVVARRGQWSTLRIHPWTTARRSGCLELSCHYELTAAAGANRRAPRAAERLRATRDAPPTTEHGRRFTERFSFPLTEGARSNPARDEVVARLFDELALAAALSYWKTTAPARVEVALPVDDASLAFHRLLLAEGMGEFAYVNGLDPLTDLRPEFVRVARDPRADPTPITGLALHQGPLVPVGGGKDSCVTIEAMRAAGLRTTLVTVRRYPVIQAVIDASGLDDLAVGRVIDPALIDWNREPGVMNGHVPVTAVVTLASLAAAVLNGHDAVALSNERSASIANLRYRGADINHQWSKGEAAERALADLVARITPEVSAFSLLRGRSELTIVRDFVRTGLDRYGASFSSCNAAFRIDETQRVERWCLTCPKCQFVGLALSAFVGPTRLGEIQGGDVFASSPSAGFAALLGLEAWKPFECVGDDVECRVALAQAVEEQGWADHPVVAALAEAVRAARRWPTPAERDAVARVDPSPLVPARYASVLSGLDAGERRR